MIIILLGPPGSGKGTQAAKIHQHYGYAHIATGDLLRKASHAQSDLGLQIKSLIDAGSFVPDSLVLELIDDRIQQKDCQKGFILDGFPRNLIQAQRLQQLLQKYKKKVSIVFFFDIHQEQLIKRLSGRRTCSQCGATYHIEYQPSSKKGICDQCGSSLFKRADDEPEIISKRFNIYQEQTSPLLDYYLEKSLLINVSENGFANEVFEKLRLVLDNFNEHLS